ncbi:beta-hexosaminidase, partial [Rhizobium brockwellii]
FRDRTAAAFAAGIDVGLHCNGAMDEMRAVAEAAPILDGAAARRAAAALARLDRAGDGLDVPEARARFAAALATAA